MTDDRTRIPPQSKAAEQQVLAAIFRLAECREDIFAAVQADDLYFDHHRRIYDAALRLHAAGHPPDLVAVGEELSRTGDLGEVSAAYLAELWDANPTGGGWEYYAKVVTDLATLRRLIHACNETARDAFDRTAPAGDLLTAHERRVFALGERAGGAEDLVPLSSALADAVYLINERLAGRGERPVGTGFEVLDKVIGGFGKGELIIVAARPSVGKSAIALNFALRALAEVPSLFFSQEMSRVELANRVLALRASVPLHAVTGTKELKAEQIQALLRASALRPGHELFIDDRAHLSPDEVTRRTRQAIRRHGVRLVIVDYLQRMRHDRSAGETTTRQVGETVKRMKTLARECNVPVLCLAQLNRDVEGRPDARPRLSDLRDSGEIEQEADVVLLLHPHPKSAVDPSRQTIDVLVEKQRNGPIQPVALEYIRPFTRFEEPMPSGVR